MADVIRVEVADEPPSIKLTAPATTVQITAGDPPPIKVEVLDAPTSEIILQGTASAVAPSGTYWVLDAGNTSTTDAAHTIIASTLLAGYAAFNFKVTGEAVPRFTLGTLGILASTDGAAYDIALAAIPARGSVALSTPTGGLEVAPYGAGAPAKVLFVPYGVSPADAPGVYAYDGNPTGALDAIAGSICFGNGLVYMQNTAPNGTGWAQILDTADIIDGGAP